MANLEVTQRNQYERATYTDNRAVSSLSPRGRKYFAAYGVFLLVVLAVLTFAAVQVFDGWHHLIVIADVLLVTAGIALWVYPQRKNI